MSFPRKVHAEPIPGYRLLEPLGQGGFGEVWKCEAPGGLPKAIKFVKGQASPSSAAEQELRSLELIRSIRHPFLLSVERVEVVAGELVIVMELADQNLRDLLAQYQRSGSPGIPRAELLGYLREAAEVLDLINLEHGLQHLDVKPRNLFVVRRHVKVADFGLVTSVEEKGGGQREALSPLYSAPEIFLGRITPFSDQYSLAITYHELLTGAFPFNGKNFHQLSLQHTQLPPDLTRLPEADQAVLERALSKEHLERYPTCSEFIAALSSGVAQGTVGSARAPRNTVDDLSVRSLETTAFVPETPHAPRPPHPPRPPLPQGERGEPELQRGATARHLEVLLPPSPLVGEGGRGGVRGPGAEAAPLVTAPSRLLNDTSPTQAPPPREPASTILVGYQCLESLCRAPNAEVWRARAPDGRECQIRFVTQPPQPEGTDPERLDDPCAHLCAIRHKCLPRVEIQPAGPNRLAIISDLAESSLFARLRAVQAEGKPGLPRAELLGHLRAVARVLDDLRQSEELFHLTLGPRQILLDKDGVSLLDFGVAELFWIPAGVSPTTINPRYSAPELFEGTVTDASDQYSLALIYQEMLLGLHPFRNLNARQLAMPRFRGQPDFGFLPSHDRPAMLRALHPAPDSRFETCSEFIAALEEAGRETSPEQDSDRVDLTGTLPRSAAQTGVYRLPSQTMIAPRPAELAATRVMAAPTWRIHLEELVATLAQSAQVLTRGSLHYLLQPGLRIEHRCWARLPQGLVALKLDGFRQQWQAEQLARTEQVYVYGLRGKAGFLRRLLGRVPGLEVVIHFRPTHDPGRLPLLLTLQPYNCKGARAQALLEELGTHVLVSLQVCLQGTSTKAEQERYPYQETVVIWPAGSESRAGRAVSARGRDLGRLGMTAFVNGALTWDQVEVRLPREGKDPVKVPGRVRSRQAIGTGPVEVEIDFEIL